MKIFTVNAGVQEGAKIEKMEIKSAGITIPCIKVGEDGRGRHLGVLPVELLPDSNSRLQAGEPVTILHCTVGVTRKGAPKLFETSSSEEEEIICVFLTQMGFRGGNSHTGDRMPDFIQEEPKFWDFPGKVICHGIIAQGIAGGMGSGQQLVAVMPQNMVFRTGYNGRMYGAPHEHYFIYRDQKLLCATFPEREASDIF